MAQAPKSNAQIQQEYAALPFLNQLGVAGRDLVRVGESGLTGGLLDRAMGPDQVEETRQAAVRAGLAGDVANVAGMVTGLKGAGAVAKGVVGAARALPTALSLVPTAGIGTAARYLTGTAGPGVVPVAAPIAASTLGKGAGVLGLLGLAASQRQDATNATPVAPAAPAVAAAPANAAQAAAALAQPSPQEQALAAAGALLQGPVSYRQFAAVANALPNIAASTFKQTNKDKAVGIANSIADQTFQNESAAAMALGTDAARQTALAKARDNYLASLRQNSGANPLQQALGAQLAAAGDQ